MNMTQLFKGALVVALIGTVLAFAGSAVAGTITQDAGVNWLAFEAESYNSLVDVDGTNGTWLPTNDASATGSKTIKAPPVLDNAKQPGEGEAIYALEFTKPTDFYNVYARYKLQPTGEEDNFFTSSVNTAHTSQLRRWFDGPADAIRSVGNFGSHGGTVGDYYYAFLGATAAVTAGTYEFRVGIREKNVELDRFIFVDSSSGGPVNGLVTNDRLMDPSIVLDGLGNSSIVVPEPASFGLLALGMLAAAGMRRRQG